MDEILKQFWLAYDNPLTGAYLTCKRCVDSDGDACWAVDVNDWSLERIVEVAATHDRVSH